MLIARYVVFAMIAMLANLAVQRAVLALPSPHAPLAYPLALGAGTLAGLVIKYLLDKRWIFYDFSQGVRAVLGLAIGYVVKYRLDLRFVFSQSRGVPA